jgi:hypothetical protein
VACREGHVWRLTDDKWLFSHADPTALMLAYRRERPAARRASHLSRCRATLGRQPTPTETRASDLLAQSFCRDLFLPSSVAGHLRFQPVPQRGWTSSLGEFGWSGDSDLRRDSDAWDRSVLAMAGGETIGERRE